MLKPTDFLPESRPLEIWAVTTGEAGMRAQALGLANRLGGHVTERTVGLRPPWSLLAPGRVPFPLNGQDPGRDRLAAPWPDLMITCGRRSAALAIGVRKASAGRTLIVHVQDPRGGHDAFNLIVAMTHDGISGPNVLSVPTALHPVTPARLAAEGSAWRERLAGLPRPLAGVLVGGSTRQAPFTTDHADRLLAGLARLRAAQVGVVLTASRRTPEPVRALLAEALAGDSGAWMWNGEGDNPYMAMLALCDRLVVTSDSVSMISEALATPAPVEVFDLGARRHQRFLRPLMDAGWTRRFTGDPMPPWLEPTPDSNRLAEDAVRRLLYERTGWSG